MPATELERILQSWFQFQKVQLKYDRSQILDVVYLFQFQKVQLKYDYADPCLFSFVSFNSKRFN